MLALAAIPIVLGVVPPMVLEDSHHGFLASSMESEETLHEADDAYPFGGPRELVDPSESEGSRSWTSSGSLLDSWTPHWLDVFSRIAVIDDEESPSLDFPFDLIDDISVAVKAAPATADARLVDSAGDITTESFGGIDPWQVDENGVSLIAALNIGRILMQQSDLSQ